MARTRRLKSNKKEHHLAHTPKIGMTRAHVATLQVNDRIHDSGYEHQACPGRSPKPPRRPARLPLRCLAGSDSGVKSLVGKA